MCKCHACAYRKCQRAAPRVHSSAPRVRRNWKTVLPCQDSVFGSANDCLTPFGRRFLRGIGLRDGDLYIKRKVDGTFRRGVELLSVAPPEEGLQPLFPPTAQPLAWTQLIGSVAVPWMQADEDQHERVQRPPGGAGPCRPRRPPEGDQRTGEVHRPSRAAKSHSRSQAAGTCSPCP
jgi:hypothetical protein